MRKMPELFYFKGQFKNNIIQNAAPCFHTHHVKGCKKKMFTLIVYNDWKWSTSPIKMPHFLLDPRGTYLRNYLLTFC